MNKDCDFLSDVLNFYIHKVSKVGDRSRGRPEGSHFTSYYIEV